MKKSSLIILVLCCTSILSWSQKKNTIPLIGTEAPSFKAESTNGTVNFPDDYGKNWKIIFSHPQDFTPVCSSEILELSYLQPEFEKLGVKIIVVSTDQLSQHINWKASLETLEYKGRNPQKIKFPLVSDEDYDISEKYGMFHYQVSTPKDIRGVFIIDPDNIVQAVYFYPMSIGRNMDEFVRTIQALQTAQNNVVIPANWQPGDDVMLTHLNEQDKFEKEKAGNSLIYEVSFYMVFRKMP